MNLSVATGRMNPAFSGTMLIPYSEFLKQGNISHEIMRNIGKETSKYAKMEDIQQTKAGILVKIDDKSEKEYQAVIAKYGINIKKVDTPMTENGEAADLASYKFMVSKLHPQDAQTRIGNFVQMNQNARGEEYLNIYKEFKKSPYSHEKIANTAVN